MDIKEELLKFKNISEKILECIEKDEIGEINPLLEKRQQIIDLINQCNCDTKLFQTASEDLKLSEIEKEINEKMVLKKESIMIKIKGISNKRKLVNIYNKINANAMIFSKKI